MAARTSRNKQTHAHTRIHPRTCVYLGLSLNKLINCPILVVKIQTYLIGKNKYKSTKATVLVRLLDFLLFMNQATTLSKEPHYTHHTVYHYRFLNTSHKMSPMKIHDKERSVHRLVFCL